MVDKTTNVWLSLQVVASTVIWSWRRTMYTIDLHKKTNWRVYGRYVHSSTTVKHVYVSLLLSPSCSLNSFKLNKRFSNAFSMATDSPHTFNLSTIIGCQTAFDSETTNRCTSSFGLLNTHTPVLDSLNAPTFIVCLARLSPTLQCPSCGMFAEWCRCL